MKESPSIEKIIPVKLLQHNTDEAEKVLRSRADKPELPILSIPSLNSKLWGLHKGKLVIIGARTSVGKSSFALQIAFDLAMQCKKVLFLSLEMTIPEVVERLFCHHQNVSNVDLLTGKFGQYEAQWSDFKRAISGKRLVVTDAIGKTWQDIDAFLSRLEEKPDVIILDYIQTIAKSAGMKEEIDEYIRHFRELAIRENYCGIICSQVNRSNQEVDDKEPRLHQLKGSGYLEELCDVCLMLHWGHKYDSTENENKYKLIVAKNRNGRTGYIDLFFKPEYYRFSDIVTDVVPPTEEHKAVSDMFGGKTVERKDWGTDEETEN